MVLFCSLLNSKHKIPQPICSMKTLKIWCLVFNLFRLVIIFLHGHVAPLTPLYEAPHKVLSRSLKTFQLQVGQRLEVVSVQRLKPAFTADYEAPKAPPRRDRPPTPTSSSSSNPPRVEDGLGKASVSRTCSREIPRKFFQSKPPKLLTYVTCQRSIHRFRPLQC